VYLRVLLREEDLVSKNPTNRDRSRHVDVKVHYLRDLVRDAHVKLVKCAVLLLSTLVKQDV
jgi:hypothetical protein